MSDYPMLISNKLHSFRNFVMQRYDKSLHCAKNSVEFVHFFCLYRKRGEHECLSRAHVTADFMLNGLYYLL